MQKSATIRIIALATLVLFLVPSSVPAQVSSGQQQANLTTRLNTVSSLAFIEPGPSQQSTLYVDGSVIELQTETVTWPILQNQVISLTQDQFKSMVKSAKHYFENDPYKIIISQGGSRGFDLQFVVSSPPSGAQAAINAVAAYLENVFYDPVTVIINIGFQSMGAGVLGSTSSNYASSVTWANTRSGLIAGMDPDDTIQNYLPSGSSIPVRYNGNTGTVTNENKCYFTRANYRATIGTVSGDAADMTINTDYSWDFDPSNGVTSGYYCFQSVLAHEIGHVLGFTSGADFRYILQDIETLDIYRFQRSDGSGDYNPDTLAEFQTTARMVDQNAPGTDDDVNSDLISVEYQMSDGDPYQCSHFSQGHVNGIMQPAISSGTTFYPDFYRTPDKVMLDAIGWDYPRMYTLAISVSPVGMGTVTKDPDNMTYPSGEVVQLTAVPINGWMFDKWGGDLSGSTNPTSITMTGNKTVIAYFIVKPPDTFPPITTHSFSGTLGDNGWFISDILITLHAVDNISGVNHTYYRFDSGAWSEYTGPRPYTTEGITELWYYSMDKDGNIESLKGPFEIKIDQVPPSMNLTKVQLDLFNVKFTAQASDETSGVNRVEFSIDGQVQFSDTESPYEWTWTGIGDYTVVATVFDGAGNSQSQSMSTPVGQTYGIPSHQVFFLQQVVGMRLGRFFFF